MVNLRQGGKDPGNLGGLTSVPGLPDAQGPFQQPFSLVEISLLTISRSKIQQCGADLRVIRAEPALEDMQRLLNRFHGRVIVAEFGIYSPRAILR